jgi:hypothetical protein
MARWRPRQDAVRRGVGYATVTLLVALGRRAAGHGVVLLDWPSVLMVERWGAVAARLEWMLSQPRRGLGGHGLAQGRAAVAALGHEPAVAEATHERRPGAGDPGWVPAGGGRLGRESVAGQGGDHHLEGVGGWPPWLVGSVRGR